MVFKKLKELLELEFPHGGGSSWHSLFWDAPLDHQGILSVGDKVLPTLPTLESPWPWWDNNTSLWLVLSGMLLPQRQGCFLYPSAMPLCIAPLFLSFR